MIRVTNWSCCEQLCNWLMLTCRLGDYLLVGTRDGVLILYSIIMDPGKIHTLQLYHKMLCLDWSNSNRQIRYKVYHTLIFATIQIDSNCKRLFFFFWPSYLCTVDQSHPDIKLVRTLKNFSKKPVMQVTLQHIVLARYGSYIHTYILISCAYHPS